MGFPPENLEIRVDSREYSRPIQTATYPPFTKGTKQTVKTHLMPFLEVKVPTLIRGTNRWGESVFHYMRMLLDNALTCECN